MKKLNALLCSLFIFFGMQTMMAQSPPGGLQRVINFSADQETTTKLLEKIEKQTGLNFVYNPDDLDNTKKFNFSKKEITVEYLLTQIFKETIISFKSTGNQIILFKKPGKMGFEKTSGPKIKKSLVVSGYVRDAQTGEAMIAASVHERSSFISTITNNFGFFSLTLPPEEQTVVISFLGYETQELKITKTAQVQINLNASNNELTAIIVSATEEEEKINNPIESPRMGLLHVSAEKLKAIPSLAGEADVLKAITLLPGVSQSVEGSAGFYVRGGGPDQNLILMDGVPMYNPNHLWGFLSTFNPDAINNIEITKGAFPARYGGRLSSVLDITLNEGNNQRWEKNISLGLLSARASISGPLKKGVSSIFFSARRTVLDLIIAPIAAVREGDYFQKPNLNFGDMNLKFNYKLSEKDRIYVSGFYSRDNFSLKIRDEYESTGSQELNQATGWSSAFGSLRWNHLYSDKLFSNTTVYYSTYNYFDKNFREIKGLENGGLANVVNRSDYSSMINDLTFKQDYQYYLNHDHHIRFGGGVIFHDFKPGISSFSNREDDEIILSSETENTTKATEYSLYVEDDFLVNDQLKINFGLHASALGVKDTTYFSLQPRVSARYKINNWISLKAGYSRMTQYLHLLTNGNLTKSSDLWVPVTKNILPPASTQYSMGAAFKLGENYEVEIEAYYKNMKNLIEYKEGANFLLNTEDWESQVERGRGIAYGMEWFIQKKKGRLTGWLGYTLSWANRTFENINFGKTFPYKYDRRHDISLVGNYQLNKKWTLNAAWVFNSGNYVSLSTSNHITANYGGGDNYAWYTFPSANTSTFTIYAINPGLNSNPPSRNNYKLPDYHRLDITVSRKKITKRGNQSEWVIGVTNVYNKFNPSNFSQSYEVVKEGADERIISTTQQYALLPVLPTLSYSLSF